MKMLLSATTFATLFVVAVFCFCNVVSLLCLCVCVVLCLKANNVCLVQKQTKLAAYRCATVKSKQTSKEYQLLHIARALFNQHNISICLCFSLIHSFYCIYLWTRVFISYLFIFHIYILINININTHFFLWTHCLTLNICTLVFNAHKA